MGIEGLAWETLQLPFAGGLAQGVDARALQPPGLTIAKDVQFDEQGGLQTRKPYTALSTSIFGGGTISNPRKLVANGDELLLFTDTGLYAWNAQLTKWVSKGTHLAIKVTEATAFATTGDQITCDRAELNGTIVFAWVDAGLPYVAALDKTTGSVLAAPTLMAGGSRPRLVALATKILLFLVNGGSGALEVYVVDPANPAANLFAATSTVLAAGSMNAYYDAVKIPGADTAIVAARRQTTTAYTIAKVTAAGAVTTATPGRTCDGPIAVSCDPTGAKVQVVRANSTNIQGDLITISSLADVFTGQAIGTTLNTPVNQIAAAHRSVQDSGAYRCYAFWSAEENTDSTAFQCKTNYVDTANSLGAQSVLRLRLGVASRAFDYGGQVYVWTAFGAQSASAGMGQPLGFRAQLQNSYFLYRDDGHLAAKSAFDVAGGFSPSIGHLPGVALTSGSTIYSWCGTERRVIPLGGKHSGYSDRGPRDITFTFDSNEARRCARIGRTLYVSGGQLLQYDGVGLNEVGFHVYPWYFATVGLGVGLIAAGAYSYKGTLRWDNAAGERERSTTATGEQPTSAGTQKFELNIANLHVTRKVGGTTRPPALEIWRTEVAAPPDSPFYLVTSNDPSVLTGDNRFLPNDDTGGFISSTMYDNFTDAVLLTKEELEETGSVLEHLAPPAASIILATDTRVFLGGVAGDPDRVWYSRQRRDNEVVSFHDGNVFAVPLAGGDLTALALAHDGTLIAFREAAIYAFPGDGIDNAGGGQNYGPARLIASDVGAVSHEAVGLTPKGIVFKSSKGWQLLNRGWGVDYIGDRVRSYDSDTIVAVHVIEAQHQVRCLTSSRMLVWDYRYEQPQWAEWTIANGLGAALWQGTYATLTTAGAATEATTYAGLTYGMDVETAWIKLHDLQGFGRVTWLELLGEFRSACGLRVRVARDYKAAYVQDRTWTATPTVVGDAVQCRRNIKKQQCEAIKVRITAVTGAIQATFAAGVDYDANPIAVQSPFGNWSPTLTAVPIGAHGNAVTLTVGCLTGTAVAIEVRDHQTWNPSTQEWTALANNVGLKIIATDDLGSAPATCAAIEAAITARSALIRVTTADAHPTAKVDMSAMTGLTLTGTFGATVTGVDADNATPPTGEALKLTGLALEVGLKRGINRRLPAAQKR